MNEKAKEKAILTGVGLACGTTSAAVTNAILNAGKEGSGETASDTVQEELQDSQPVVVVEPEVDEPEVDDLEILATPVINGEDDITIDEDMYGGPIDNDWVEPMLTMYGGPIDNDWVEPMDAEYGGPIGDDWDEPEIDDDDDASDLFADDGDLLSDEEVPL